MVGTGPDDKTEEDTEPARHDTRSRTGSWDAASGGGFLTATIRSPVADPVLGHGEVVCRCLHAVLIRVQHDGKLLSTAENARLHREHEGRNSGTHPFAEFRPISC